MRLMFVDSINWDYSVASVYEGPLGGSQSALCLLAESLAHRGHEVSTLTNTSRPGPCRGVICLSSTQTTLGMIKDLTLDACVILNGVSRSLVEQMRNAIGPNVRLILWAQHATDQPAVCELADANVRDAFDAFVLVSDWQRSDYITKFGIPSEHSVVLRNAVAPAFADISADPDMVFQQKRQPLVLAYTSTPFRGLNVLLQIFPQIRAAVPETRLKVYSSMQVYRVAETDDSAKYGDLYRACRETEGVDYVGSLPQAELAQQMRAVAVLAYPNTFAETSCIAVMEAMAAGCHVITSDLGALPETTAGFATLVPVSEGPTSYSQRFVESTVEYLRKFSDLSSRVAVENGMRQQMAHVRQECTWSRRAEQWEAWLTSEMVSGDQQLFDGRHKRQDHSQEGFMVSEAIQAVRPRAISSAQICVSGQSQTFSFFDTPLGRLVCQEVLDGKSYPLLPFLRSVKSIVDIGANVGAAAVYFASYYPHARVVAFEPAPDCFELLSRNTCHLSNVSAFNFGLFDQNSQASLYLGKQDSVTNSIRSSVLNTTDSVSVPLREAQSVFKELKLESIDVLKLDTEGCEVPILRSIAQFIPQIGVIYVEYHRAEDRLDIDRLLTPTHVLFRGQINNPHRGELCYVTSKLIPADSDFDALAIEG